MAARDLNGVTLSMGVVGAIALASLVTKASGGSRSTRWPTEPITEDNVGEMSDKLDGLASWVGEASHSRIRNLKYASYESEREIRRIEEAWGSWDWGELEALGIVTKEQADFAREVVGFMTVDLTEWSEAAWDQ